MAGSRRVSVAVDADVSPFVRGMTTASLAARKFSSELESADSRLSNVVQAGLALAPAFVPLGAAAVPAVAGLVTQLGFAAGAAGTAVIAFQGIGDALEAVNEAQLSPTTENLAKMDEALQAIGPAGAEFVKFLQSIRPELSDLQNVARQGLFPGVQEGIESLMQRMPEAERIIAQISSTLGDLADSAGDSLASDEWDDFFAFLEREAQPTLTNMGQAFGNVVKGLADMIVAFEPAANMFRRGMVDMSESFADWAAGLGESEGFRDFLAYIKESGPQALDALGGIAEALVAVVEASAPVGSVMLPAIEGLAKAFAALVQSPIGPPIVAAAVAINSLALALKLVKAAGGEAFVGTLRKMGPAGVAAGVGLLAVYEGLDAIFNKLSDLHNDNFENLPRGIAALADGRFTGNLEKSGEYLSRLNSGIDQFFNATVGWAPGPTGFSVAKDNIKALDETLASMVESGNADIARSAMVQIQKSAQASGVSAREAAQQFPQYNTALKNVKAEAEGAADGLGKMGDAANDTTAEVRRLADAVNGLLDPLLDQDAATVEWERSLASLTKELKGGSDALNINTKRGQNNRDAIRGRVQALQDMINADAAAGESQATMTRKLMVGARQILAAGEAANISTAQMRDYLHTLGLTPKQIRTVVEAHTASAEAAVRRLQSIYAGIPRTIVTQAITNHIDRFEREVARASGGYVSGPGGPTDDLIPARLSDGEYVIKAAAVDKYGVGFFDRLNAMGFAEGGYVGFANGGYTLDQRAEMLRLERRIRQLMRDLRRSGEDALKGIERTLTAVELRQTRRDLRAANRAPLTDLRSGFRDARQSFDVTSDMGVRDVREQLREFRRAVKDAGGEWTGRLRKMSDRLIRNAKAIRDNERSLENETKHREKLGDKLEYWQSQMDDLVSTMQQFGGAVGGNFLTDPFNGAYTETLDSPVSATDPALIAARDQLGAAEARLAGIRGRTDLDPLERSYLASRAVAEVANLRDQVEQLDRGSQALADNAEPIERTVSGLEALKETLLTNTKQAQEFANALATLAAKGLDTTGPFGGLYAGLAQSGDLGTAQELAGLSPAEIDEYEKLFARRDEVVAQLAAQTTQAVYGEQQRILQERLNDTNRQIARSNARLERIENRIERHGDRIENINAKGFDSLSSQIGSVRAAVRDIPRETRDNKRGGKGRS